MRQFVAMINGSTNSGLKKTKEEAIDWAQEQLSTNMKFTNVHICEQIAVVERASAPIAVRDIPQTPEQQRNAAYGLAEAAE